MRNCSNCRFNTLMNNICKQGHFENCPAWKEVEKCICYRGILYYEFKINGETAASGSAAKHCPICGRRYK